MTETRLIDRLAVKAAAFVLTVLLSVAAIVGIGGTAAVLVLAGELNSTEAAVEEAGEWLLQLRYRSLDGVATNFYYYGDDAQRWLAEDLYYTITDENGTVLFSNYDGQPVAASVQSTTLFSDSLPQGDKQLTVTVYLPQPPLGWSGVLLKTVENWHRHWGAILTGSGVCLLGALLLTVYLLRAAGWRAGETSPRCNAIDRIPFDVYLLLLMGVVLLQWPLLENLYAPLPLLILLALCSLLDICLLLAFLMSVATRIKTHTLWHNTLIGWLLRGLGAALRGLPLVWKTALLLIGFTLLEFLVLITDNSVLILLAQAVIVPLVILYALGLRRLQIAAREIARGNLGYSINTRYMTPEQRRTAEDLSHIGDGLSAAVEGRLKSERFKTELITNVSHDIKTPLTSIINYVDLLDKAHPEGAQVQEYLAVLKRQSARLKKLIEDLVEASKASTGNLPVHPAPCNLNVLLEQVVGEYEEKLAAAQLTPVLTLPDTTVTVLADGRHLWRVLDNLLNNISKYTQPDTRVYLDLTETQECARITFRNISRSPLHISSEELMERFVRGDSSRNTEGSGLGLSIARSLTELQGGQLLLAVDGDLFKVILLLPLIKKGEQP